MLRIIFQSETLTKMQPRLFLLLASKLSFLKHLEGSAQHETLLVLSLGSLHMNTSIEDIVCVHRVY